MKKTKLQKGITLIALIITIVVLLILAIVTIGAVKDSGIIGHAKSASSKYTIEQEKEEINVALGEWQIEKNIPTKTAIFKDVMGTALSGKAKVEGGDNGPLTITMNKTGNQYTVTDDGEVTPVAKEISIAPTELSLAVQGTKKLTVSLAEGLRVEDIKYSSSDESVATVNESGEVTGVALGEATITAECNGHNATCKVKVREPSLLEKYILGADLAGRPFTDIINTGETISFKDDEETQGIDETQTIGAKFITIVPESNELGVVYFEIQGVKYKFGVYLNSYLTDKNYGIVKLYEPEEGTRVGKTVKYDNKIWTILYDDSTNGLQMISNQSLLYNNSKFWLGDKDSLITDWSTVTGVEFDGSDGLSQFEKAVYSYNHAIDTLNTACESLVTSNPNITDVRCVGSNPIDKSAENKILYTSENLEKMPTNNTAGIGNNRGKSTDQNYVSDFERMLVLGANIGYDSTGKGLEYYMASRYISGNDEYVVFSMKIIGSDGNLGTRYVWEVRETYVDDGGYDLALRPVVSLSSNIQLVECTTGEADYTF